MKKINISHTQKMDLQKCSTYHHNKWVKGIRSMRYEDTSGMVHGRIGHIALEYLYKKNLDERQVNAIIDAEYHDQRMKYAELYLVNKKYKYDAALMKAKSEILKAQLKAFRERIFLSETVNFLSAEEVVLTPVVTPSGRGSTK